MKKCNCEEGKHSSPPVVEIHNNECPVLFHKVLVPAAMGDDIDHPPKNGQYRNVLLVYEANKHAYLFSSDGIPTFISGGGTGGVEDYEELLNKPLINGHELIGDSSLDDIGVTDAIDNALDDYTPTADLSAVALSGDYDDLINKPTIPTVNDAILTIRKEGSSIGTFTANSATNTTINVVETDPTVPSWAKQPTKPTYSYSEITNKPTIPTKTSDLVNDGADNTSTYVEADELATVATSGSYNDLSNKPTIPAAQVNSDWNASSGVAQILNKPTFATVATSGSYNDLTNKPTIPAAVTVDSALSNSSTNPVENQVITSALGTKANTFDVSTALAGKQDTLTVGNHISISNNTISAVDYVHSDDPVSTTAVTPVVTNNMIADGTITAEKFATGATLKLTLSTSDIGEGAALAANTLYGVYQ